MKSYPCDHLYCFPYKELNFACQLLLACACTAGRLAPAGSRPERGTGGNQMLLVQINTQHP
jgi:hypothetical protein